MGKKIFLLITVLFFASTVYAEGDLIVDGKLGVGTTTPTTAVDVNGTVKAIAFAGDGSGLTGVGSSTFTDRGSLNAWDKTNWITNGAWHDWDLSSIVPAGKNFVLLRLYVNDDSSSSKIAFRKKGTSGGVNEAQAKVDTLIYGEIIVAIDTDRIIEYAATNTSFTEIDAAVVAYW